MKFFLDTANIDEIERVLAMGLVDGVTTNPTIIARAGNDFEATIKKIAAIVPGPISAEVSAEDHQGMIREAQQLATWAANVVIKIPVTEEGLIAVNQLSKQGIKTNVTLIFSVAQGLMAAKAGANYVSPFIGRLDDISVDGIQLVRDLRTIFTLYDMKSEIIAASIRTPRHVEMAALAGAHIATIPGTLFDKLLAHPLTDNGLTAFRNDWEAYLKQR